MSLRSLRYRARLRRLAAGSAAIAMLLLTGCHHQDPAYDPASAPSFSAPALASPPVAHAPGTPRRPAPESKVAPAAPTPDESTSDLLRGRPLSTEVGLASWYGPGFHAHQAADGSTFDENAMTVAHRTLPMGTMVRVTNLSTNRSVVAKVTDRGPFVPGRTLDLSLGAAKAIGVYRMGVAKVKLEAYALQSGAAIPEGRWCVQIGAFIDPADAQQLKNDLAGRYAGAKVISFVGPTGSWVRINPVKTDQGTAQKIAESIHLPDAEPYLVRTN